MTVTQISTLLNTIAGEVLGTSAVVTEDLSNVVTLGEAVFANTKVDNYVKSLIDHVGKMIFVDRPYRGRAPSVLYDSWEWGSVLQKVQMDIPQAKDNQTWSLTDGSTYNQDIFYKPTITVKFFNAKDAYSIPMSFTTDQVKESFTSPDQMTRFVSMIYSTIDKALTLYFDSVIMRTINNFTAVTLNNYNSSGTFTGTGNTRAINLLALYNADKDTANKLPAAQAMKNPDFLRFASYQIRTWTDRMTGESKAFNIGAKVRYTPTEDMHVVMLSEFASAASVYLYGDTYHKEDVKMPVAETVPFWQGSGADYAFSSTSAINVKINDGSATAKSVSASGILCVAFDTMALGVFNPQRKTTTHYNAAGDFTNNFFKASAEFFNDTDENFIVFYIM